jgi:hypothetical protein
MNLKIKCAELALQAHSTTMRHVVTKAGAFDESLGETTGKKVAAIAKQIESYLDSQ